MRAANCPRIRFRAAFPKLPTEPSKPIDSSDSPRSFCRNLGVSGWGRYMTNIARKTIPTRVMKRVICP